MTKPLNSSIPEKYFNIHDKTGRGISAYDIPLSHIQETWDLEEEDYNDKSLADFLEECYVGDAWESRTERIECVSIQDQE